MHGSHFNPNSLLLLLIVMAVILIVESLIPLPGARKTHFDGHVLCRIKNGNAVAEVPVKDAEVKLMEGDLCWLGFIDCDDTLGSAITDTDGAFNLDGHSREEGGVIEPYLAIKACHKADDESSCNVKKFTPADDVMVVKNYNYFLDDEFCQHCQGGGECKSA